MSAHVLSVGRYNNGCQRECKFVAGGIFPLCVCQWVIFTFFAAPICKICIYSESYKAVHTSALPFHYPNAVKANGTAALLKKPTSLKCVQLGKKKTKKLPIVPFKSKITLMISACLLLNSVSEKETVCLNGKIIHFFNSKQYTQPIISYSQCFCCSWRCYCSNDKKKIF